MRKSKRKLRVECCLKDRLLYFFFELCLYILHKDEIGESFFLVSESPICMISYAIESSESDHTIDKPDQYYTSDNSGQSRCPVSVKLVERDIAIDVAECVVFHIG